MMNTQWAGIPARDAMMLTYGDFKKLPKNDKRSILRSLPFDDFISLTEALKTPATNWPEDMDGLTLRDVAQRMRSDA